MLAILYYQCLLCTIQTFLQIFDGLINSLLFNSKMAFLLQFQNYEPQFPKPNRISLQKQESSRDQRLTTKLLTFLRENQSTLGLKQVDKEQENMIAFQIGLTMQVTLIFRLYIKCKKTRPPIKITFFHKDRYWCVKSRELMKNFYRTLKSINLWLLSSNIFIVISPQTGEVQLKISSNILPGNLFLQRMINVLVILLNSLDILRSLTPILLYTCNIITQAKLKNKLKMELKKAFYGLDQDFNRFDEVYEMMPLINSHYKNIGTLNIEDDLFNYNRVLQLYYKQLKDSYFKDCQLFTFLPQFNKQPLINLQQQTKKQQLNFPESKPEDRRQFPFIFNTIHIFQHNKSKDFKIFEGGKSKIIISPCKFIYDQSHNSYEQLKQQCSAHKHFSQKPMSQYTKQKGIFQRSLLVKMPRENNFTNTNRQFMTIRYQKKMLSHFRTCRCKYLARYFHTVQPNYDYKHLLLMDYVQGLNLFQEMYYTSNTCTLATRLFILSHIANAIRFLESYQVAHLDLNPNNIIVDSSKLIKVIDFGQAYHPETTKKFAQNSPDNNGYVYAPGRTFPYAPPETSSRILNFSSQQDMFSFGMIIFQLLFKSLPIDCSQLVIRRIYRSKKYMDRIFLAPEKAEDLGQVNLMLIIMNLTIRLLDPNEKTRPFPLWSYLILKKLAYSIR